MRSRWVAWGLCALTVSVAHAESKLDCSKGALRKARQTASQAVRGKDYKAAIAALGPYANGCVEGEPVEIGWLVSDLAVVYLKSGDLVACRSLIDKALFPKSDIARAENDKLNSALEHNGQLCEKAFDAQYEMLKADACTLPVGDVAASVALPAALVPKGASAACLAIVGGSGDQHSEGDAKVVCPHLALVTKGAGDKLTRKRLGGAKKNPLDDEGLFCCGYNTLAVGIKEGKALVRIGAKTPVRECSGGTAEGILDEIYEWKGSTLTSVVSASSSPW